MHLDRAAVAGGDGMVVGADVAFHGMGQGIHAGGRRDGCGQAGHQRTVQRRHVGHELRVDDRHLLLVLGIRHDGGDRVLNELAATLRDGARSSDVPGRLGGDEFTIADITAMVLVDFAAWSRIELPAGADALKLWYEAVSARPSARA